MFGLNLRLLLTIIIIVIIIIVIICQRVAIDCDSKLMILPVLVNNIIASILNKIFGFIGIEYRLYTVCNTTIESYKSAITNTVGTPWHNIGTMVVDPSAQSNRGTENYMNVEAFSDIDFINRLKGKNLILRLTPFYEGAYQVNYVLEVSTKEDGILKYINLGNNKDEAKVNWRKIFPNKPYPVMLAV